MRALASEIFAPNFWLSAVHFLRSLSFAPARTKMRLFTTTTANNNRQQQPPTTTANNIHHHD
jgi:hypothetical protein